MKKLIGIRTFEINLEDLDHNSEMDLEFELMGETYWYSPTKEEWFYITEEQGITPIKVLDKDKIEALNSLLMKHFEDKLWEDIQEIVHNEFTEEGKVDFELHWDIPDVGELHKQLLELTEKIKMLKERIINLTSKK